MRRGVLLAAGLRQERHDEEHEAFVMLLVFEHPQPLFRPAKGFRLAALRGAEFGQLQVAPWRG